VSTITVPCARPSRRRSRAAITTAALACTALLFSAAAAPAAITTGPVDPNSGFPFSYTDDLRTSLQLCQDVSGFCVETPRPLPNDPISVPENFTEDEEGFWWLADATVPNAGRGLARFAKEAAFDTPGINPGHQVSFSRIRFRFDLQPNATYRITHPYGVDEITADATGVINFTEDVGCLGAPCGAFAQPSGDRITGFLTWDPIVPPSAPAGYVGNGVTPHTVIGSPTGTNFVLLERLSRPGGAVGETIGRTDQFIVQGKVAGAPPPPAPHAILSTTSMGFGARQVGNASTAQPVTVSNHGTAPLAVSGTALAGTDAADFGVVTDGCANQTIAPGASCSVAVRFLPGHTGSLGASLVVASNAPRAPHTVALSGEGTPGPAPAPVIVAAPAPVPQTGVAGTTVASRLAVGRIAVDRRVTRRALRRQGLQAAFRLPPGTRVIRFAVFRARNGRAVGKALARGFRRARPGPFRLRLRNRALVRKLRPGSYIVRIRAGRSRTTLGRASQRRFRVVIR
jgi:hypothetical protein